MCVGGGGGVLGRGLILQLITLKLICALKAEALLMLSGRLSLHQHWC